VELTSRFFFHVQVEVELTSRFFFMYRLTASA